MNYNKFAKPEISGLPLNNRAKLDTGTECNYKCSFCYYINDLDKKTPFETIKERIDSIADKGIREIDLSGGESSIHSDWFEILEYTRKKFNTVSCLSNGHKFADYEFAEQSFNAGLTEILFSLHGWDSASHANIVGRHKSFERLMQAIQNCHIIGIKIRLNCTVTEYNASHMEEYAAMINVLGVEQINFLPLNYWSDAVNNEAASYEVLSDGIKKAIKVIEKNKTKIQINVRYIPYCFMKGYEKYVVGTFQHIYDLNDWNIAYYEEGIEKYSGDLDEEGYFKIARQKREYSYTKPKECYDCKYFDICDGIEHVLKEQEVFPIKGDKIKDPMVFRDGERI